MTEHWYAEVTLFEKQGGALSKRLSIDPNGKLCSDGSACLMTDGTARRFAVRDVYDYAGLVNDCSSSEALALGRLKDGLPQRVRVVTADKLNGRADPAIIARTKEFLIFDPGAGRLVSSRLTAVSSRLARYNRRGPRHLRGDAG